MENRKQKENPAIRNFCQQAALNAYLSYYPENLSFDEITEMLYANKDGEDESGDRPIELPEFLQDFYCNLSPIAEMIEGYARYLEREFYDTFSEESKK